MQKLLEQIILTHAHANLRYRTAWVLYALILVLGSIPGARADLGQVAPGLILHATAYAGITFLLFTGGRGSLVARGVKAVLTIAAMGALDELVQSFLPYRHGAVSDWAVDVVSACVTASIMWRLWTHRKVAL